MRSVHWCKATSKNVTRSLNLFSDPIVIASPLSDGRRLYCLAHTCFSYAISLCTDVIRLIEKKKYLVSDLNKICPPPTLEYRLRTRLIYPNRFLSLLFRRHTFAHILFTLYIVFDPMYTYGNLVRKIVCTVCERLLRPRIFICMRVQHGRTQ